jgi:biopolymer transport protein TolR
MGMAVGGSKRGTFVEMNVVPLIDILLVLLVIFMMIPPEENAGLDATAPQPARDAAVEHTDPALIVVQVLGDESLRINQQAVAWDELRGRLEEIFKFRAQHVAFVRGDGAVEFGAVAKAIAVMRSAGISTVGLLTPELEKGH